MVTIETVKGYDAFQECQNRSAKKTLGLDECTLVLKICCHRFLVGAGFEFPLLSLSTEGNKKHKK